MDLRKIGGVQCRATSFRFVRALVAVAQPLGAFRNFLPPSFVSLLTHRHRFFSDREKEKKGAQIDVSFFLCSVSEPLRDK